MEMQGCWGSPAWWGPQVSRMGVPVLGFLGSHHMHYGFTSTTVCVMSRLCLCSGASPNTWITQMQSLSLVTVQKWYLIYSFMVSLSHTPPWPLLTGRGWPLLWKIFPEKELNKWVSPPHSHTSHVTMSLPRGQCSQVSHCGPSQDYVQQPNLQTH